MANILTAIKGIFSGKSPIDSIKDLIGEFHLSPDEKQKFLAEAEARLLARDQAIMDNALNVFKVEVESVKNTQEMAIKIQGEKPSWLAKNVAYLMDLFVMILWGALTAYLMAVMLNLAPKQVGVDYTAVTAVWGAVTAVFTQVLQFHRGSSQGSKDNRALLDKVMNK
jgi:hypothetical protein